MTNLCANSIAERQHDEIGARQEIVRERFVDGRADEILRNGGKDRAKLLAGIADKWAGQPESIESMLAAMAEHQFLGGEAFMVKAAAVVGWVREIATAIAEREWEHGDAA